MDIIVAMPSSVTNAITAGCQNWPFYICLLIFYFWNCIYSHLARSDFFMASDSEPGIYVSGEAAYIYIIRTILYNTDSLPLAS